MHEQASAAANRTLWLENELRLFDGASVIHSEVNRSKQCFRQESSETVSLRWWSNVSHSYTCFGIRAPYLDRLTSGFVLMWGASLRYGRVRLTKRDIQMPAPGNPSLIRAGFFVNFVTFRSLTSSAMGCTHSCKKRVSCVIAVSIKAAPQTVHTLLITTFPLHGVTKRSRSASGYGDRSLKWCHAA